MCFISRLLVYIENAEDTSSCTCAVYAQEVSTRDNVRVVYGAVRKLYFLKLYAILDAIPLVRQESQ